MSKLFILISALIILLTAPCYADIFDTYGYGTKGLASAGALVAQTDSAVAVYYNPAGLGRIKYDSLGFSYLISAPSLSVSPGGSDIPCPDELSSGMIISDVSININRYFNLPVNTTFAIAFNISDDFSVMRMDDIEENRTRFLRYGSQIQRSSLYMGLGLEVIKNRLWLGCGSHVMISGRTAVNITLESDDLSSTDPITPSQQDVWADFKAEISPTLGIILSPFKNLFLGFSFKDAIDVKIDPILANLDITIGSYYFPTTTITSISSYFIPQTFRGGISYQFTSFTIEAAITFERWSKFSLSSIREERRDVPLFNDTYSYHAGILINPWPVKFRAGYQFAKSPLPERSTASNLLDADRHIAAFGIAYDFKDPLGIIRNPVQIELGVQRQFIIPRRLYKDAESDILLKGGVFAAIISITFKTDFHNSDENNDAGNIDAKS